MRLWVVCLRKVHRPVAGVLERQNTGVSDVSDVTGVADVSGVSDVSDVSDSSDVADVADVTDVTDVSLSVRSRSTAGFGTL